jgi:hypothetical protein
MGSGEKDKRRIGYGESGEKWVERAEAKVFAKRERYKKLINHATSPKSLEQVIHTFRKLLGHTPYVCTVGGGVNFKNKNNSLVKKYFCTLKVMLKIANVLRKHILVLKIVHHFKNYCAKTTCDKSIKFNAKC